MNKLLVAALSIAWLATAVAQTPAKKESEAQQATQGAMQQRDYAGEQGKVKKTAKPKTTAKEKASEVDAATGQAMQQRDYAGEKAKSGQPK